MLQKLGLKKDFAKIYYPHLLENTRIPKRSEIKQESVLFSKHQSFRNLKTNYRENLHPIKKLYIICMYIYENNKL